MRKTAATTAKPAERLSRPRQRQKLIDACITALYHHGPSRTTIDKVVSIADMSPGIVNFYFESKATLLLSTLEYLAVEFEEQVLAPLLASLDRPVSALERLIALYFDPDIASCRKVSVWYSFWGEASSRSEYQIICGKRDQAFNDLVRDLIARLITQSGAGSLDADAIALGLVGALEILWQEIAFQTEADVDRAASRRRCLAYLQSVFPKSFASAHAPDLASCQPEARTTDSEGSFAAELKTLFHEGWQWIAHESDVPRSGDYVTLQIANERAFMLRADAADLQIFRNACSYRPHQLVASPSGQVGDAVRCTADGSRYTLHGVAETRGCGDLVHLGSSSRHGLTFVSFSAAPSAPPPLPTEDVAALGLLLPLGSWTIEPCQANWKRVVEHWLDGYMGAAENIRDEREKGETEAKIATQGDGISWRTNLRFRRLFWPNLLIETRSEGMIIRQVLPHALVHSSIRMRHYVRASADKGERARSSRRMRLAQAWAKDDANIAASTEIGLASSYRQPDSFRGDAETRFRLWLRERL